jgi:hypothetical protein
MEGESLLGIRRATEEDEQENRDEPEQDCLPML